MPVVLGYISVNFVLRVRTNCYSPASCQNSDIIIRFSDPTGAMPYNASQVPPFLPVIIIILKVELTCIKTSKDNGRPTMYCKYASDRFISASWQPYKDSAVQTLTLMPLITSLIIAHPETWQRGNGQTMWMTLKTCFTVILQGRSSSCASLNCTEFYGLVSFGQIFT